MMAGFYNCLKGNNDCAMATGPVDLINPLNEEANEGFSRKKKSKFQTFKNFFAKKKKNSKDPPSPTGESSLKPSQSSSDVSTPNLDSRLLHLPVEPGSKGNMGNKALSHDSVFIFESSPDITSKTSSQENLSGRVKALQLRLQQNLRLGSPPLVLANRKAEDVGAVSEDDGLPRSPPEISTLHDILTCPTSKSCNPIQRHNSLSLGGTDSEDDQVPSESSSRPLSPLSPGTLGSPVGSTGHLLPADFDTPATPLRCLDTSAARHKIAMNPRKQKAFASKTPNLSAAQLKKEQYLHGHPDGETNHPKLLEETDGQEAESDGASDQNASNLNGDQKDEALPRIKALRYSWNAGPGGDQICVVELDTQNHMGTECQATARVPEEYSKGLEPSPSKSREGGMEKATKKRASYLTGDLQVESESSRQRFMECFEPLEPATEVTGPWDVLPSHRPDRDPDMPVEDSHVLSLQPVVHNAEASFASEIQDGRADDKPGVEVSSATFGVDPSRFPSPTVEASSEATKSTDLKDTPRANEDADHRKLFVSLPRESTILDASLDSLLVQSTGNKKSFLPVGLSGVVSNSSLRSQEAVHPSSEDLVPSGSGSIASEDSPSEGGIRDRPESTKKKEETKPSGEMSKVQAKSTSTKPVRFTIAPAWQRSLSGGSNSVDASGPRSSPSSPICPELFEGIPPLEAALQGCLPNSPERCDKIFRNMAANLHTGVEWPKEDGQDRESPFGVKLRRTSSLLKYQAEQQHHEPPRQVPLAASESSSVATKEGKKLPGFGKPLQNVSGSSKTSVTKPNFQEEKNPAKANEHEEMAPRQQIGRLPEQSVAPPTNPPSSEPVWVSMAKLKQRGFQDHPLGKAEKREATALPKGEQEGEKDVGVSQLGKQAKFAGENLLKKPSTPLTCTLESIVQPKITAAATKAASVKASAQEALQVEKEMRSLSSLPMASCSPAEPPWLSLAKKKARAWNEMPQIVQ